MSIQNKRYKYYGKLFLESTAESDRAVAILLSAEIDEILKKIIKKRMVPHNKKVNDRDILSSYGALGTFYSRIDIGYRLGILDSIIAHDLHLIRKIRNLFAHETHGLHFELPEPKQILKKSKIAKLKPYERPSFVDMELTKKEKYFVHFHFFDWPYWRFGKENKTT